MARRPGKPWGIYLESANGGQIAELLREDQNIADPSWSPDGKSLVYGREPDMMGKDEGPRQLSVGYRQQEV
jgi:Tol biopolymer transport system component